MLKSLLIFFLSLCYSALAVAQDEIPLNYGSLNLGLPQEERAINYDPFMLQPSQQDEIQLSAANTSASGNMAMTTEKEPEFEEDWLTANKIHKYLGIGSLTFAILAAISPKPPKDNLDDGNHKEFAEAAAFLGGAAVATGLVFHYDDIFNDGISDPDNLHALYATIGALGYALAVNQAPEAEHAGYGMIGALSMIIGIKYTW